MRRRRTELPFAVALRKFTHDRHPGTDIPKRFASDVTLIEGSARSDYTISMNQPLRHGGLTFYQSSFGTADGKQATVLQVVRNPAAWMPYVAVLVMSLGLLAHFGLMLVRFVRTRRAAVVLLALLAATPASFIFSTSAVPACGVDCVRKHRSSLPGATVLPVRSCSCSHRAGCSGMRWSRSM